MSRAENALMRLYESASLRDELTDEEAQQLFKWAEDELMRLDESGVDDATFEARAETLLDLTKQVNRYAGRQGQFAAQGVDDTPEKIAGLAHDLGHDADAAQIAAAGTGDPMSTVQSLTELLSGSSGADAQAAEQTESPAAPTPTPTRGATSALAVQSEEEANDSLAVDTATAETAEPVAPSGAHLGAPAGAPAYAPAGTPASAPATAHKAPEREPEPPIPHDSLTNSAPIEAQTNTSTDTEYLPLNPSGEPIEDPDQPY